MIRARMISSALSPRKRRSRSVDIARTCSHMTKLCTVSSPTYRLIGTWSSFLIILQAIHERPIQFFALLLVGRKRGWVRLQRPAGTMRFFLSKATRSSQTTRVSMGSASRANAMAAGAGIACPPRASSPSWDVGLATTAVAPCYPYTIHRWIVAHESS